MRRGLRRAGRTLGEIFYGMALYDWVRDLERERGSLESLFALAVFGDYLGVPILPPYYTLRLLPYAMPALAGWRRRMLREKDLTDLIHQDLG